MREPDFRTSPLTDPDDIGTALRALAAEYPAFRFRHEPVGHRKARWVAERKTGLDPGLHTVITSSFAELCRALTRDGGDGDR